MRPAPSSSEVASHAGPGPGPGAREPELGGRARPWLPWALFAATAFTTTWAWGPAFAATLLAILGAHEMGHFWVARRVGVPATPPYFIPLPPVAGLPGTLGAVIGIGADRADRDALAAVAVAGPVAGFVVALPLFVLGLLLPSPLMELSGDVMFFGRSLLTGALEAALTEPPPPGFDRAAHPVFFAAWVGLFVTGLNLLPMGQLDGGHLMYAWSPRHAHAVSRVCHGLLLGAGALGLVGVLPLALSGAGWGGAELVETTRPLRALFSPVFVVWALLAGMIGLRHPPIRAPERPLSARGRRRVVAGALLLALVFVPNGIWADRRDPAPSPPERSSLRGATSDYLDAPPRRETTARHPWGTAPV